MGLRFSDAATTVLISSITTSSTSLQVESVASFPQSMVAGDYFIAIIANAENTVRETIKVTAINYTAKTLTVVRAQDDTLPMAWPLGSKVEIRGGSALFKEMINTSIDLGSYVLANEVVTTPKIIDGAVTTGKLASSAVTTDKIANNSVTVEKINATGTPNSNTFLSGNGSWRLPGPTPGYQLFTSSGTFTVPANVTSVEVYCIGGGGGGSGGQYYYYQYYGNRGGAGGFAYGIASVTPGEQIAVTVGGGGGGVGVGTAGAGGSTSFGSLVVASGGSGAFSNSWGCTSQESCSYAGTNGTQVVGFPRIHQLLPQGNYGTAGAGVDAASWPGVSYGGAGGPGACMVYWS